ncbi:MAG: hypothetical protein HUJ63_07420 [Enterococcus sp.]|nr:hypothetical protein [Enterococcus sp.]
MCSLNKKFKKFKMDTNFEKIPLYMYNDRGSTIVTPKKPGPMVEWRDAGLRLTASEGTVLTKDDVIFYKVKDINQYELPKWYQVKDISKGDF